MALARSTHTAMLLRGACSRFLGPAGTSPPTVGARRQLALATAALSAGALWSAGSGGGTARAGCVAERTSRHSSATRESEQQGEAAERLDRLAAQLGVKKCGAAGCELGRDLTYAAPLATDCVPDPEDFKSALRSPPPTPNPHPPLLGGLDDTPMRVDCWGGSRPRLVTFDLDDTLWDTWVVLKQAHVVKQAYITAHYPRIAAKWDLEASRAHNVATRNARPDLAHSFTAAHQEAIRLQVLRALPPHAPPAAARRCLKRTVCHRRQRWATTRRQRSPTSTGLLQPPATTSPCAPLPPSPAPPPLRPFRSSRYARAGTTARWRCCLHCRVWVCPSGR